MEVSRWTTQTSVVLSGAAEEIIAMSRGCGGKRVARTDELKSKQTGLIQYSRMGKTNRDTSAELFSKNGFYEISVVLWAYPICSGIFAFLFVI